MIILSYGKNHLIKILSSLIVKFSDVQAKNFCQVKLINCYLRELSVLLQKIDIRDWGQSRRRGWIDNAKTVSLQQGVFPLAGRAIWIITCI